MLSAPLLYNINIKFVCYPWNLKWHSKLYQLYMHALKDIKLTLL